jgi:hypothetical protein
MKKTITTKNEHRKKEVKMALPFLASATFVARIKRAAMFEGIPLNRYLTEGIESLLEHSEDHMVFNDGGEVVAKTPWISSTPSCIPTPLKKPLPALAA